MPAEDDEEEDLTLQGLKRGILLLQANPVSTLLRMHVVQQFNLQLSSVMPGTDDEDEESTL